MLNEVNKNSALVVALSWQLPGGTQSNSGVIVSWPIFEGGIFWIQVRSITI
jgi:hypothetical protein